eukprot:TRINITY_DN15868_c0_g1_i5.p3 TRINITY_DN15868_c0_g1~~TRINITY_DN15868_c0_g1_i5.p3  ORF type:complete len:114 (-),score=28.35 TRINITY_DN15868_c0_g1_i5:385-726(-)
MLQRFQSCGRRSCIAAAAAFSTPSLPSAQLLLLFAGAVIINLLLFAAAVIINLLLLFAGAVIINLLLNATVLPSSGPVLRSPVVSSSVWWNRRRLHCHRRRLRLVCGCCSSSP